MYDAIVIGGGPGGYVAAIRLSQLGKKVAIVEKEYFGGTCTNKGCIPTKAMLTAAHLYRKIKEKSQKFGITVPSVNYETDKIIKHVAKSVTMSRKGIEYLLNKNHVAIFKGTGVIKDKNTVEISETKELLKGKNLILAQGSKPSIFPPFDKVESFWTSDDVFNMKEIPQSIVIIGGGVIGVEFATFFGSLGKEVSIIELMNHILPTEDEDVAKEVKKSLLSLKVKIYEKTRVKNVSNNPDGFAIEAEDKNGETLKLNSEKVLFAVGRRPNISEDIKNIGVEIKRGVVTNKRMQTNIDNVYAIGDIRGDIMLAHVAMHEGMVAAHNIALEDKVEMNYSAVPFIIFSNPEVASVGIKEYNADPDKIKTFSFPVSANGRATTMAERRGFSKVIADKESGKTLGLSIVSVSATDMIMEGVMAVKKSLKVKEIYELIHPHPTLTETILGAFEGIDGLAIHI